MVMPQKLEQRTVDAAFAKHWSAGANKYHRFRPLAVGGTATLQTCIDANLGREVVFKSLHPHLARDEDEQRRFVREARVTSLIAHPGTVSVHELGRQADGTLYFTMKRLRGRDLRQIVDDLNAGEDDPAAALPTSRLLKIVQYAATTLAFAHECGVVHRDLKPANVLAGDLNRVVVLDWGLAKLSAEPADQLGVSPDTPGHGLDLTAPGRRYGTPLSMSPEQARGDADLDHRTDVYGLGCILYELLTLRRPIEADPGVAEEESLADVTRRVLTVRPTAPSDAAPAGRVVPPALAALAMRMLEKKPADRPQTMQAVIDELEMFRRTWRQPVGG